MRFKLISVGRERADQAAPLVRDYLSRIGKLFPIEDVVLPDDRPDRLAARIMKEAEGGSMLVALDERGQEHTSMELAKLVSSWMERGVDRVSFVIGGADGLLPEIKTSADLLLALSRMTLPHRLARLLLAEQLFRACCIIRKIPYQK